jgi:malonate-semialdehyde dehydrogenase (acetylating)/methylmalonate-semialdehyde dehydrogenase
MDTVVEIKHFIDGVWVENSPDTQFVDVVSPVNSAVVARVPVGTSADVDRAVAAAERAFESWSSITIKQRAAIMFRLKALIERDQQQLAELIMRENGKNITEALADVAKGNETVEWACSLPQLAQGKVLEVSKGIHCADSRIPLGVVGCIVPFNFPVMVPLWTVPIALTVGNCVILKPSEKVPSGMVKIAELLVEAGIPPGVFQMVNGTAGVVTGLCDHPNVKAVSFVGSSKVAKIVAGRCHALNKKVLALGGAKNHLVALPDADIGMASRDIVASFAGCCGQRCMAASVLVLVGECSGLLEEVVNTARTLQRGQGSGQVGPLIDGIAKSR